MDRRQRPIVTGVHGLEHIQALRATYLAQDDPVRPHTEGILHQLTLCDFPFSLDIGRPCLQPHHMFLAQLKFRGVFDRHNPFVIRDKSGHHIQQRGFPRPCPA